MSNPDFTLPEETLEERQRRYSKEALEVLKAQLQKTSEPEPVVWTGDKLVIQLDCMLEYARFLRRLWVIIDTITNSVEDLAMLSGFETEFLKQIQSEFDESHQFLKERMAELDKLDQVDWSL